MSKSFIDWYIINALALDAGEDEQWITTKNGHHVLLDGEGEIQAGMGGKFNGENISEMPHAPKILIGQSSIEPEKTKMAIEKEAAWAKEFSKDRNSTITLKDPKNPTKEELMSSFPTQWSAQNGERALKEIEEFTTAYCNDYKYSPYIDYAIRNSTAKWKDGELYRGMKLTKEELATYTEGAVKEMQGLSSWSQSKGIANSYSNNYVGKEKVVLVDKTAGERNALSIGAISELGDDDDFGGEKEVLYAINQKIRVNKVYKATSKRYGEITYVEVEAI